MVKLWQIVAVLVLAAPILFFACIGVFHYFGIGAEIAFIPVEGAFGLLAGTAVGRSIR